MKTVDRLPFLALFLSGFAALLFQVIWSRQATLLVGTSTEGITLVICAFMGGLGLGSALVARYMSSFSRPLLAYAWVEVLTAVLAIAYAFLFSLTYTKFVFPSFAVFLLVFLPTTLMGMTVPLVIRQLEELGWNRSGSVSWAYGINTTGAALGAVFGAFWVLPELGLKNATLLGAFLLILAASLAGAYGLRKFISQQGDPLPSGFPSFSKATKRILFLAFAAGFVSLSLEIVWTRLLSLILGPSVFALGLVLFVFLLGLALGALVSERVPESWGLGQVSGWILILLGFALIWGVFVFALLPFLFIGLVEAIRPHPDALRFFELFLSGLTIFPLAILHGAFLPILIRLHPSEVSAGKVSGWALSANTFGAIAGSAFTGLVWIPSLGFQNITSVSLVLYLGLGAFVLLSFSSDRKKVKMTLLVLVPLFLFLWNQSRTLWDRSVLASGVYKYAVGDALGGGKANIQVGKVLFYREGKSSTVAVIETANDRILSVDGKADASARGDQSTQVLLAALPLSFSKAMEETLVIGYASGVTAGTATLFEETRVTAVEIEPYVYEAADFFKEINFSPLDSKKHDLRVGDGRHFLLDTDKHFDVITSEPSNPWMSGVSPLFTLEFFKLAKSRIAPGGVMCQWLPIYGMSSELVASVMHTFAEVFPHILVFESVEGYDLLLLGSSERMEMNPEKIRNRWKKKELIEELRSIGIFSGEDLVGRFLMGRVGVEVFSKNAVLNTDDNGYLEYRAPQVMHLKTAERNDALLSEASEGIQSYLGKDLGSVSLEKIRKALVKRGERLFR